VHAYRHETYVESGSSDDMLDALTYADGRGDDQLEDVHTKRTQYGADIVAMLLDLSDYCGTGWSGDDEPSKKYTFSVTRWDCATGGYTFAHELGYNFVSSTLIAKFPRDPVCN
jgi:hypothetical protein